MAAETMKFILKVSGEKYKTLFCFEKLGSEFCISYIQAYLLILHTTNWEKLPYIKWKQTLSLNSMKMTTIEVNSKNSKE